MELLVCVKQVPNTNEVRIDPKTNVLIREGVASILNPDDANALEAALAIKDQVPGSRVTVLSMGPPQADILLRECLAMGADEAVLLSAREFAGADTWATSNVLAAAIEKLGKFDIIFAGRQAIDGDTAQVGPQIATKLDLPQVTYVEHISLDGENVIVHRALEDGYEVIRVKMPMLLTAVKQLNTPRYMSIRGIYDAYKKQITVWGFDDLGIAKDQVGFDSSPTFVIRSYTPPAKGKGIVFTDDPQASVKKLTEILFAKKILRGGE